MPTPVPTTYELTFILGESADQTIAAAKTEEIKATITEIGGTVKTEEFWGRRELAYVIAKNRSGFYVTLTFEGASDKLKELEQRLQFDQGVIRSLLTKAYTTAQPGSLAPQEENPEKERTGRRDRTDEKTSGEEQLRRSSPTSADDEEVDGTAIPEDERRKKVDESIDVLLAS